MRIRALLGLSAAVLYASAGAVVLEDFEHGQTSQYTFDTGGGGLTNNNFSITAGAAHDGMLGGEFAPGLAAGWNYRTDRPTLPGVVYTAFVRFRNALVGDNTRAYIGIGASSGGTYSMVAGFNTSEIQLQQNAAYSFSTLATAPAIFSPDTWYDMEILWAINGDMTVSLYDETRTNLLAQTPTFATGNTTPGGIAVRGFNTTGSGVVDIDTIAAVPEPATILVLGALAGCVLRRKRK